MSDALTSLMRCPQDTVDLAGQMLGRAIQKSIFPSYFAIFSTFCTACCAKRDVFDASIALAAEAIFSR